MMQSKRMFASVFLALTVGFAGTASAGVAPVGNTSAIMAPSSMAVGGDLVIDLDPSNVGGLGRFEYGLSNSMDLSVQLGSVSEETYLGADVELPLAGGRKAIAGARLSAMLGGHMWHDPGVDVGINATWQLQPVLLYTAFDADVNFHDSTTVPVNLVVGFVKPIRRSVLLDAELGVDLNDSRNYVAVGLTVGL